MGSMDDDFLQECNRIGHEIEGIERMNLNHIAQLEQHLDLQIELGQYHPAANFTLLKLYMLQGPVHAQEPERVAVIMDYVEKIFLKALMSLPSSDFLQCKYLLTTDWMRQSRRLAAINDMAHILETCNFRLFWQKVAEDEWKDIVCVPQFESCIRSYICHVVNLTFQTINRRMLVELLGDVTDDELARWIDANKWKTLDNGCIFVTNQEDKIKPINIKEKIQYKNVAALLATLK